MLSAPMLMLLRAAHIVLGVLWVGALVFMTIFLLPTIRAIGPAGGAVMQQLMEVRRLSAYLATYAIVTVLSGIALYWNASLGFTSAWLQSGPGRMFGAGGIFAIIAVIVGMSVNNPGGRRMAKLAAEIRASGGPPSGAQAAELQRLQVKMTIATRVVAVLVLLATTAMAVARYV